MDLGSSSSSEWTPSEWSDGASFCLSFLFLFAENYVTTGAPSSVRSVFSRASRLARYSRKRAMCAHTHK
ncbi:hypothetical protein GZH46_02501, partial [Fragariocoptes setiger]